MSFTRILLEPLTKAVETRASRNEKLANSSRMSCTEWVRIFHHIDNNRDDYLPGIPYIGMDL